MAMIFTPLIAPHQSRQDHKLRSIDTSGGYETLHTKHKKCTIINSTRVRKRSRRLYEHDEQDKHLQN